MSKRNTYILFMTILPWLTAPFIGGKTIRRFLPGSIFMCIYLVLEGYIAEKKKWWWFPYSVRPNVLAEIPLIIGPFFIGSLWVFKYTFGKFKLYMFVNFVIDSIFSFLMLEWFKKIGYASLVRLTEYQLSLLFLIKSFLMYGFQYAFEMWKPFRF